MTLYGLCVTLHLLAMSLWLGHMLVWSLFAGPALKAVQPPATAEMLRERSVYLGALGWPALAVLVPTGLYLLHWRGIGPGDLVTLSFLDMPGGGQVVDGNGEVKGRQGHGGNPVEGDAAILTPGFPVHEAHFPASERQKFCCSAARLATVTAPDCRPLPCFANSRPCSPWPAMAALPRPGCTWA